MNKTELIERISNELDGNKSSASRSLDAVLHAIASGLQEDGKVTLPGFGTFAVTKTAERTGRNPATGEPITIAAGKRVGFKAGAELKRSI